MKRATKWTITLLGSLALITGLSGCNRGHWGFHHHNDPVKKAEWIKEEIDDHLDLTDPQKQQLDQLADTLLTIHLERKESRKQHREQAKALIAAPTLDQTIVLGMVQEHTDYVDLKAPEVIAAIARFTDTLNQEQRNEILEKMDKWSKRFDD